MYYDILYSFINCNIAFVTQNFVPHLVKESMIQNCTQECWADLA